MFKKFTKGCVTIVQKYLPDPFLFAAILTFIVFGAGLVVTDISAQDMLLNWSGSFWNLLKFSMQMVLVLVTGYALANAPIIKKGLSKIAGTVKSPGGAIFLVTFVATVACWINWGFGLVVGALLAKELAAKVDKVDYRLLIASAYSGFIVWHSGLSGSIPLKLASGVDLAQHTEGAVTEAIATNSTIFSYFNIIIFLVILVTLPFVNRAMHPKGEDVVTINPKLLEPTPQNIVDKSEMTPADKLENSPIVSIILGIMGISYLAYYFFNNGLSLNLNIVNFLFLFLAIILHKTPRNFLDAVIDAVKGTSGIIIQFPFYAGIMGMMVAKDGAGLSLAGAISSSFVNISSATTFPLYTFLSAGIVNFFVPSGGGQWAVQAPIMMPAGMALGVPAAKTAMAIAWGDAWTNMIQPFWALPALGIAGLGARDIMGFCVVDLLYTGIIIATGLMLLP